MYLDFALNRIVHSAHHSAQFCAEQQKTTIVQSVIAERAERLAESGASFSADDVLGLQSFPPVKGKRPLADDLAMARKTLAERSAELARLDGILAPVWSAEDAIKNSLVATHDGGLTLGLNLSRRNERTGLFKQLDAMALKWGKTKNERRFVNSEIRSLGRLVDSLSNQIEKQRGKHGR